MAQIIIPTKDNWKIIFDNKTLLYFFYNEKWVNFFKSEGSNEEITAESISDSIRKARIELTLKCNLACKYCIVYKNFIEQINTHMNINIAKEVLDKINRIGTVNSLMIMWWEPLTNLESLKYLCENFKWKKALFTNWILLTKELVEFFCKTNTAIMISLDWKRKHNINRLDIEWKESFDIVVEKIKLIKNSWWKVTVNTLVTNESVKELFDIVKYFSEELWIKSFWLSFPHYTKENVEFAKDFDYMEYTNQMMNIFTYSKENWIYVNQIKNILKTLLNWKIKKYWCKIVWEQITFYPDWKQTYCAKLDTLEKLITPSYIKKSLPVINPKCDYCIAKSICWWWCPWDNHFSLNDFDERMCYFNVKMTEFILKDFYNELKQLTLDWNNSELKEIYSNLLKK